MPEVLYSFNNRNKKDHRFQLLHAAKGISLKEMVDNASSNKELIQIFFALGQAIAALNLHLANCKNIQKDKSNLLIEEIQMVTNRFHEDLHWNNIFVNDIQKS